MPMLSEADKIEVQKRLEDLKGQVRLVMFTQELECQYCRETRELLEDVASLSDKISLEVYNFILDGEEVKRYGVDKIPAV
ncbi:MAG TPA: glutaredoxin, partial [Candidatus Latescibacteria bacterium]|nr:glutaredoxin [Candidatus Latescibacterota bacterium]